MLPFVSDWSENRMQADSDIIATLEQTHNRAYAAACVNIADSNTLLIAIPISIQLSLNELSSLQTLGFPTLVLLCIGHVSISALTSPLLSTST